MHRNTARWRSAGDRAKDRRAVKKPHLRCGRDLNPESAKLSGVLRTELSLKNYICPSFEVCLSG